VRACQDAVQFNSIKVSTVIPGGYQNLKVHVHIGVPRPSTVDLEEIVKVFPYGTLLPIVVEEGGLWGSSTINMPDFTSTGKANDDLTLAVACITLGYDSLDKKNE